MFKKLGIQTLITTIVVLVIGASTVFAGVDDDISEIVGKQNKIYFDNQPIPIYNYSAPRDIVTQLYNITVPNLPATWTIFYSMDTPIDSCASRGFPIPYGVQLTSSEYMKTDGNGGDSATSVDLPQPDPDGLYKDGITTTASWVLCDYGNGGWEPVYNEFYTITFMHPVGVENGKLKHYPQQPSAVLDLSRVGSANNLNPNSPNQD